MADLQTKIDNKEKQTMPNETEKLQDKINKLTKSKDEEKKKNERMEKAKKENEKHIHQLQEQKEQDDKTISKLTKKLEETKEMAKDLQPPPLKKQSKSMITYSGSTCIQEIY